MKYLDLCALHEVNLALNFDTQDSAIIGGCDLYTTKAAGGDKKLYKRIEKTLEDRHRDLLSAVADMSPESAAKFTDQINLERNTPFGSFNETSNRHTFAYLIATLNATHVDYDFANTLNPDEFGRETKKSFMHKVDMTMYYLRPQIYSQGLPAGAVTPLGSPIWSPRSWQLVDSEMDMEECEYYVWQPSDDPFADDGAIWSHHFFLYNKDRKRVCYFYLRGISALSNSPTPAMSLMSKLKQHEASSNAGSRKRAEYWLGSRAKRGLEAYGESDELDNMVIEHPEDVVDAEDVPDLRTREASHGFDYCSSDDDSDIESYLDRERHPKRRKSSVRTLSDHLAEQITI
ncbi:repressor of RNA polymerase III transcription MAF1 [Aaosphaeria arxii CBS 175.79]|uniref:Repressor of RNA polymerase III transcription MAF1 n=1 Tax=Aaosphaeria arxii CBS 175.79 TaxID=1450172 RepID=A0A6A5XPR7_9PLEO|nr:repressor of RNA polymerase III transcription MAF1 [Aaosphaeria arxii CBS 175.79]KAF2014899.1 repressor of RNA polymerase III transcription MAF1 [Aaosphaeria arxii CBS 175.79]